MAETAGNDKQREEVWEEFHLTLELLRIMFEIPEAWALGHELLCYVHQHAHSPGTARAARANQKNEVDWRRRFGAVDWGCASGGDTPQYLAHVAGPYLALSNSPMHVAVR